MCLLAQIHRLGTGLRAREKVREPQNTDQHASRLGTGLRAREKVREPQNGPAREPTRNGLTSQGKSSGTVRKSFFQGAIAGNCVKNRTKQVIINF